MDAEQSIALIDAPNPQDLVENEVTVGTVEVELVTDPPQFDDKLLRLRDGTNEPCPEDDKLFRL